MDASHACVRCPWCLRGSVPGAGACLDPRSQRVTRHWDINGSWGVAPRYVWHCPHADTYFTHPGLQPAELGVLYAHYSGQADARLAETRARSQAEYVRALVPSLRRGAVVAEAGCSFGQLLAQLSAPDRNLVCFEPSATHAPVAAKRLAATHPHSAHVVRSMYNASSEHLREGIDLFVSSHVLEHVADLCTFLRELYARMRPGGHVFSEVPNNIDAYVRWQGTQRRTTANYHVNLFTPQSALAYMSAAGFRLVDMQLAGRSCAGRGAGGTPCPTKEFPITQFPPRGNGQFLRFVFAKPQASTRAELSAPMKHTRPRDDGTFAEVRLPA